MRSDLVILNLSICFFVSCQRPEQEEKTSVNNSDSLIKTNINIASQPQNNSVISVTSNSNCFDFKNTILSEDFNDTIISIFSNPESEDIFTFFIPKGNINSTTSIISIHNKLGQLVYETSFNTTELVNGYSLYKIKSEEEMVEYILQKASSILDKNSFIDLNNLETTNTILKQAKTENFEDYDVYLECKEDERPLFRIGLKEENIIFLGYSRIFEKVVVVFRCC